MCRLGKSFPKKRERFIEGNTIATKPPMSDTPRTDAEQWTLECFTVVHVPFAEELERELNNALRSLRLEENARKILTDENDRLRKLLNGKTFVTE